MTTFLPPKLCTHHGGLKGLLIHPASTHATTQPSHFQMKSYIFCTRAMSSSTDCFWFTKKRTGRLFLTRHGKVLDSDRSLTTFNYTLQYFPRLKWGGSADEGQVTPTTLQKRMASPLFGFTQMPLFISPPQLHSLSPTCRIQNAPIKSLEVKPTETTATWDFCFTN
jgi:hypothetical protein